MSIEGPFPLGQKLEISPPLELQNGTKISVVVVLEYDGEDIVVGSGTPGIRLVPIHIRKPKDPTSCKHTYWPIEAEKK